MRAVESTPPDASRVPSCDHATEVTWFGNKDERELKGVLDLCVYTLEATSYNLTAPPAAAGTHHNQHTLTRIHPHRHACTRDKHICVALHDTDHRPTISRCRQCQLARTTANTHMHPHTHACTCGQHTSRSTILVQHRPARTRAPSAPRGPRPRPRPSFIFFIFFVTLMMA